MNALDRLLTLAAENEEAGERLRAQAPRFLAYRERHLLGTAPQAVTGFNLFQTPPPIAARMAAIVGEYIKPGARILEPSAGLGRLVEPFTAGRLADLRLQWEAVEEAGECVRAVRQSLRELEKTREADFLQLSAADLGGQFAAVVMNPPFKQGRDIKHIRHALDMVEPGGVLVSLCYNGTRQNEQLKPIADTWEVLPPGSFREEGTGAEVALLTIRKT